MIEILKLLSVAIAPGIAISIYVYQKDKIDKEPLKLFFLAFLLGVFSAALTLWLSDKMKIWTGLTENKNNLHEIFLFSVIGIGLVEELSKWVMVKYFYFNKHFSESFDGIVYSVWVSMGFATIENILYVMKGGMDVALVRMFVSVPAHAAFGVIMGVYLGKAKFENKNYLISMILSIAIPSFYHGLFDFFLIQKHSTFLILGAFLTFLHIIKISRNYINKDWNV